MSLNPNTMHERHAKKAKESRGGIQIFRSCPTKLEHYREWEREGQSLWVLKLLAIQ